VFLEVRGNRRLSQLATVEGRLVSRCAAQGEQQPSDPRMGLAGAGFAIIFTPLMLTRHAGSRLSTIKRAMHRFRSTVKCVRIVIRHRQ
jgi:hypothetical protein